MKDKNVVTSRPSWGAIVRHSLFVFLPTVVLVGIILMLFYRINIDAERGQLERSELLAVGQDSLPVMALHAVCDVP